MFKYNIGSAKMELIRGIKAYLLKDANGKYVMREKDRLPFFLQGPPGLGKTQITEEAAKELGIGFVSFSLTHHTRTTVLGLPVIEELGEGAEAIKYTRYTMSEIMEAVYAKVKEGYPEGVLLLDEFPCMAESIMPIMLAFLQVKNIGAYTLPEGWVIVLCGNPPEYNKASRKFDAAVLDRVRAIELDYDVPTFLDYAEKRNLHGAIQMYLKLFPEKCFRCVRGEEGFELVTGRGWENLSETIKAYGKLGEEIGYEQISQFIKSEEVARDFAGYYEQCVEGGDLRGGDYEAILSGQVTDGLVQRFSELGLRKCWKQMDYLFRFVQAQYHEVYDGSEEQREFAKKADSLLDFAEKMDHGGLVGRKLLREFGETELLLRAMGHFPQPVYSAACRRMYRKMAG